MTTFLLDQDVAGPVGAVLASRGHQVWDVARTGLADASDEVVVAYAHLNDAVVVTHDAEMAERHRRRLHGRMVWLVDPSTSTTAVTQTLADALTEVERHLAAVPPHGRSELITVRCRVPRTTGEHART